MGGFTNAVVGGAETLIRSAIRSFNYVAGIAGWRIAKDGSAELNNATIRGTVVVGNGTITMGPTGIHVQGIGHQWDINFSAGFISRRSPDDGTEAQIFDAGLFLTPQSPSPKNAALTTSSGQIFANNLPVGSTNESPAVVMVSPTYSGKTGNAFVVLQGQTAQSASDDSQVILNANTIQANADIYINSPTSIGRGLFGYGFTNSNFSSASNAEQVLLTTAFSYTFKKSRVYEVKMHSGQGSVSVAPNRVISRLRKGSTTAGVQLDSGAHQFANTGGGDGSWTSVFAVNPSNDVSTPLCWTLATGSTFTFNWNTPLYMTITDIGYEPDTGIGAGIPTLS